MSFYINKLLQLAENGDTYAQLKIGDCYYHGLGVEKDYKKAIDYFQKSVNVGAV